MPRPLRDPLAGGRQLSLRVVHDGSDLSAGLLLVRSVTAAVVTFLAAALLSSRAFPHDTVARLAVGVAVVVMVGMPLTFLMVGRPARDAERRQATRTAADQAVVAAQAVQFQFAADLQEAFDMVDTEAQAHALITRALPLIYGGPAELLIADSSRAHLTRAAASAAGTPGCAVSTPGGCPAIRRGHSTVFESSASLAACPHLAERGPDLMALCVPVTILGAPMGVLHVTAAPSRPRDPRRKGQMESLAVQAGSRIGALRATASTQLAAATDPLTGLLNRRSLADAVQRLAIAGAAYAVVFADLDSFKALNDTHGHATGDHALRLFSTTLTTAVREPELVCRYGGEEFLIVLPGCTAEQAAPVVHRIRAQLAAATATAAGATPGFTASYGLADSTYADDPLDVIAAADVALLRAKAEGKDRLIIADHPTPRPALALLP